ncbi:Na-H-Exchanger domain-containing protein [Fusarium keratoplasticum]|uniref:Na-H-Exchanger domain-containing protein n=1 Tax=Fusarium keratoplasticum TaxID=1328300 RepID=A0ACC0R645_9HYPO|nr:Na-H-Exchanger domain-containing protein [Fusarium keratoplasticum]KAI8675583.1 Na-H-Exchanger domain-containing protein [Fusarium keratoplasticum]
MSATTTSAAAAVTSAHPQGGIIEGLNPIHYNPKDPISLFIIQAIIIIVFCRLLHYPLSKFGQPRVIAEVIGGIVLGPSVMMRIPGFKENIFPTESMPVLTNVATLGLLLFLFLVGLEVDTRMFKTNWRVALSVGLASMIIPFGLGVAVAWGLFKEYGNEGHKEDMEFGTFALFIGTALAITAFPVLCRILSELQLLSTSVGVTVLAAGIGNDVTGWVLLALSVALVNNANGLTALYVFLTAAAWVLFLVFAVRPAFLWVLRRTDSIQNGPSQGITTLTLLLVLASSWFTAAIGVHAIFGAFLIGVICPHDGGFAIKLTEKIEDLVGSLLLPLYFALSGLNTNLGLLNDGKTWGYVIAVILCAFFGKIFGGSVAARWCHCLWRESFTIGVLMSCKGLVELIVLNIGLQAGILSPRTFTMFVVMALVTTVTTTPLTRWLYPVWYRQKVDKWRRGEIDWDGTPLSTEAQASEHKMEEALDKSQTNRVILHLRLDALSGLFNLVSLLGGSRKASNIANAEGDDAEGSAAVAADDKPRHPPRRPLEVRGIRLMELTDRTSSVMQSTEVAEFTSRDAVFSAFQTFSRLNGVAVAGQVSIIPTSAYAETLAKCAEEAKSDFMLIPWSTYGGLAEENFGAALSDNDNPNDRFFNRTYVDYVQNALERSTCTTGVYISRSLDDNALSKRPTLTRRALTGLSVHSDHGSPAVQNPVDQNQHIFVPFIGGEDDRAALLFVLQLAHNPHVSITVVHLGFNEDEIDTHSPPDSHPSSSNDIGKAVIGIPSASDMDLLSTAKKNASGTLEGRVTFIEVSVDSIRQLPDRAVAQAREVVGKSKLNVGDLVVVGRSHPFFDNLLVDDLGVEREFQRTVGVLGDRFARAGIDAGLLVIHDKQAKA